MRADNLVEANEFLKTIYKKDLFSFAKHCLGYKDMTWETHGPICEALQADTKRKLVCVPRSTFKSSLCTIAYPIWRLIQEPNLRVLLDSELYSNSKNFLREIKAHLASKDFIEIFGNWKTRTWNEGEIIIAPRTRPLKEASIACSGIGAEKTSTHWDEIIGDDLSTTQSVNTPELAQKVIDHYRLYTSLLEPDGTIVLVGTRYSERDIIGFIIENELGCKSLNDLRAKLSDGVGEIDIMEGMK